MKFCDYCLEKINGGAYITRERKYHFCSEPCMSRWEKENPKNGKTKEMS